MRNGVSKSDWKHFNVVRAAALERLCSRILDNVREVASDESKTPHERFLSVYEIINESNQDVARGFDSLSRSRMMQHLVTMKAMNLLEQTELEGFSEKVQEQLERFDRLM